MLIPAGTGRRSGIVNLAGQSTETIVAAQTRESVWLVKVNLICFPVFLTVLRSTSYHTGEPASTLAPLFQSKVTRSSRRHGFVVSFTTSKPNSIGWSVVISRYTSFESTLLYAFSNRISSSRILPSILGASIPKLMPEGIGIVILVPVVYWQSDTIPIVT